MNTASTHQNFGDANDANDASIGAGTATVFAKIATIKIAGTTGGTAIPLAAGPSTRDIGAAGDVSIDLI